MLANPRQVVAARHGKLDLCRTNAPARGKMLNLCIKVGEVRVDELTGTPIGHFGDSALYNRREPDLKVEDRIRNYAEDVAKIVDV